MTKRTIDAKVEQEILCTMSGMIENFDVKALTVEVGGLTGGGDCMRASYFDIDPRRRRDRKRLWLSITKWIEPHGTWP